MAKAKYPVPLADANLAPIFAGDALRMVARVFSLPVDELISLSRARHVVEARKVAIWLLRVRPKHGERGGKPRFRSIEEICARVRAEGLRPLDHSSASFAIQQVGKRAAGEPAFAALLLDLALDNAPLAERRAQKAKLGVAAGAALTEANAALTRLLNAHRALRPSMALEADDTDARDRASGSMKLTAALCEWLRGRGEELDQFNCREPAANRGHMVRPLAEYFRRVEASDIYDYGAGYPQADYLFGPPPEPVHFTITNPPFKLAEQFIERMAATSEFGFAVIVRSAFVEGVGRFERLFSKNPPSHVLQFTERVVMHKGRLAPEGSTATAYCWLVWLDGGAPSEDCDTAFEWIAPCRKRLERPGDYE